MAKRYFMLMKAVIRRHGADVSTRRCSRAIGQAERDRPSNMQIIAPAKSLAGGRLHAVFAG